MYSIHYIFYVSNVSSGLLLQCFSCKVVIFADYSIHRYALLSFSVFSLSYYMYFTFKTFPLDSLEVKTYLLCLFLCPAVLMFYCCNRDNGASTKRPLLRTLLPYITVLVCVIPCIIYS